MKKPTVSVLAKPSKTNPWRTSVKIGRNVCNLDFPPHRIAVQNEIISALPLFNLKQNGWERGMILSALNAFGCSMIGALIADSFVLRTEKDGRLLVRGKDYELEAEWGTVGRLENASFAPDEAVSADYEYAAYSIDSIVQTPDGSIVRKPGRLDFATPEQPALDAGETRLANIFYNHLCEQISDENIYPVSAHRPLALPASQADRFLPKTMAKLRAGKKVRYCAWGDSVTAMIYLPSEDRWVNRFSLELARRFPAAEIETVNLGWGGRCVVDFLNAPSGDVHNYEETILASKADFMTLEFVNDGWINQEKFAKYYGKVAEDLRARGIELIVLTPHLILPSWMPAPEKKTKRSVDPRPLTSFLRSWAEDNHFALADVSRQYCSLRSRGIPYMSLMTNGINHPNAFGSELFSRTVSGIFPQK